jgi:hypothetical protein
MYVAAPSIPLDSEDDDDVGRGPGKESEKCKKSFTISTSNTVTLLRDLPMLSGRSVIFALLFFILVSC